MNLDRMFFLLFVSCTFGCFFLASIIVVLGKIRKRENVSLVDQTALFLSGVFFLVGYGLFCLGMLVIVGGK